MALPSQKSEKEPLLAAHSRHPYPQGYSSLTSVPYIRSPKSPSSDTTSSNPSHSSDAHSFFPSSLHIQILIAIMVAIPTYMLASTAIANLGPLEPRNSVIRSPQPDPLPQSSSSSSLVTSDPSSDPFASILGPHISTNFPDPAIIYVDGVSYAFATNNRQPAPDHINIQVATSTDNQTWTMVEQHDALPTLGAWETGAGVWAPDVVQLVSHRPKCSQKSQTTNIGPLIRTMAASFFTMLTM